MKKRLFALLIFFMLLLTSCTPKEGSKGILFKASDGKTTVYLLGSIHVGSQEMYPFGAAITQAMQEADRFVFECDSTSSESAALMQEKMRYSDGTKLNDVITPKVYQTLCAACEKIGVPISRFDGMKPWAVVSTLSVFASAAEMGAKDAAQATALGVESKVRGYAQSKPCDYLETVDAQLSLMEDFSPALQEYLLSSVCEVLLHPNDLKGMDKTVSQWPDWWRTGNMEAFRDSYLETYLEPGYEAETMEYHEKLIASRNQSMASSLQTLMRQYAGETLFVTVGLMHLVLPDDSIPEWLTQSGVTVQCVSQP